MRPTIAVVALAALLGTAAKESRATMPVARPDAPVVRISVEIVQLDAVVTDRKGHHVTDLGPEDFVVYQDGTPQKISRFAFERVRDAQPGRAASTRITPTAGMPAAVAPHAQERTIVFVVDDTSLSAHSFVRTRLALRHALKALEPSDRVAIVAVGRGAPGLVPTTDRQANLAAVAGLRRTPWTREELMAVPSPQDEFAYLQGVSRYDGGSFEDWNARLALRSMAVIKRTIHSLQSQPGRKALILVSEGFSALNPVSRPLVHDLYWPLDRLYGDSDDLLGAWRRLGDFAARSGVVVYAVDPRGLVTAGINAEASVPDANQPGRLANRTLSQHIALFHSQGTLQYLADETGGLALLDRNDLGGALTSVVDDLGGYYLIGYQPAQGTFAGSGFHDIKIKVKRPGLKVRTRKGFFAVTDTQVADSLQ